MKKAAIILVGVGVCLVAGFDAEAQTPYIGLFGDAYRMSDAVKSPYDYFVFQVWVWCRPGEHGQMCSEFRIDYPPGIIPMDMVMNPDVSVYLGDTYSGISLCFSHCQYDEWVWQFYQRALIVDPTPVYLQVEPHPVTGEIRIANCQPGYPVEVAYNYSLLGVNSPGG